MNGQIPVGIARFLRKSRFVEPFINGSVQSA